MAHLKNFGVGNFRAFKNLYNFDFAPITVLTGTNSSGKSSLTKAMLLLKKPFAGVQSQQRFVDSFKTRVSINSIMQLKFVSELQLGNFETVKNSNTVNEEIAFDLPFRLPECTEMLKLRLLYVNDGTNYSNGKLHTIQLINPANNLNLIEVTENKHGFACKTNYQALWDLLERNMSENEAIKKADDEYMATLIKHGLSEDTLDNSNFPEEVTVARQKYLNAKKKRPQIYFEDFNSTSLTSQCIYFSKVDDRIENGEMLEFNNSSLLNYLFLYEENYVKENIKSWYPNLSQNEIAELMMDYHKSLQVMKDLKRENENNRHEVIRRMEFEALPREAQFGQWQENKGDYDYTDAFKQFSKMIAPNDWLQTKGIRSSILFRQIGEAGTGISASSDYTKVMTNKLLVLDEIPKNVKYPDQSVGLYFFEGFLFEGITDMFDKLKNVFLKLDYIPSVRTKVERFYKNSTDESFLQECIDLFQSQKIDEAALTFFEKWVKEFGVADMVRLSTSFDSTATRIELVKGNKIMQLADVGYGYAQLLPVLISITLKINSETQYIRSIDSESEETITLRAYKPSILIIEEPETNLHPALQSKLADMFVECYKEYNIQLIIETHSEYLIRRLQRRTAEFYNDKKKNEYSIPDDFTKIYYFYPPDNVPEGEKQIYPINIQKDGSLSKNFGKGFFDEASTEDLLLYQTAKHNKN